MSGGWNDYISELMKTESVHDAAIVGLQTLTVWAAYEHGNLKNIQPHEVKELLSGDLTNMCTHGITLGAKKCTVIRNQLAEAGFADLKVKATCDEEKHCIAVAKSKTAFIILEGSSEPSSGGKVNLSAFKMADHLKNSGY